jgi:hypothetical protein
MNIDIAWLATQFPDLQNVALLSKGGQKLVSALPAKRRHRVESHSTRSGR